MLLTNLQIRRFRNLEALDWAPSPGLNLIAGDNGQGKTNLLEAIHLGALGRSFRAIKDEELLPWAPESAPRGMAAGAGEESGLCVFAETQRKWGAHRTRVTIGPGWKRVYQDDQLVGRLADLLQSALVVAFTPADVDLFRDSPGRRRRFLDQTLCQLSAPYLQALSRYQRALKQANALLKNRSARDRRAQAEAFYAGMAESGAELIRERTLRVAELGAICLSVFEELGGGAILDLKYIPSPRRLEILPGAFSEAAGARAAAPPDANAAPEIEIDSDAASMGTFPLALGAVASGPAALGAASANAASAPDTSALRAALMARLVDCHDESERQGSVAIGPHRDDLRARRDGRDLGRFGSQGQNRLAALALKLASARALELAREEPPILLLDDFGSELDPARRAATLGALRGRIQVFVTATRERDMGQEGLFDEVRALAGGAWA